MSEYQYYEFRAIERPLTAKELREVRALSTRAEITPTSFTNHYEWGDFRGDPRKMMQKYYDVHVYYANWGTVNWMIRVPKAVAEIKAWEAYVTDDTLNLTPAGQHVVVELSTPPDQEPEYEEDPSDWAELVVQLRTDLLAGDLRILYLGWLTNVILWEEGEEGDEDDTAEQQEPPVPPGLSELSPALKEFCRVFHLDANLLTAAAEASAPMQAADERGMGQWIAQLSSGEKDRMLLELARGERPGLGAELRAQFLRAHAPSAVETSRRTVRELLQAARAHRDQREAAAARRAEEQRKRKEAQRREQLERIAANPEPLWAQAQTLIGEKTRDSYKEAAKLLTDLRDAAALVGGSAMFAQRFKELVEQHRSKSALQQVLRAAHLTQAN